MEPSSNASFIPKSPRSSVGAKRVTKRVYILSYVSYVLFFTALLLVVAVYVYSSSVNKNLEQAIDELNSKQAQFDPATFESIRTTEKQLIVANDLWKKSAAPSKIFTDIERIASDAVTFQGFQYEYNDNDTINLEIVAVAPSFNDVAYQTSVLDRSQVLRTSNMASYDYLSNEGGTDEGNQNTDPTVNFTLQGTIPVSSIPFEGYVASSTTNQVASDARPSTSTASVNISTTTNNVDQN